jgi:iron complex transport system substrate-binding protein
MYSCQDISLDVVYRMKKFNFFLLLLLIIGLFSIPVIAAADGNKTIIDSTGNSVVIPANVSRVVTVDPFTSQFIFVIGASDKLVGTCIGPSDRSVVNTTEPELASLPSAGCKTNVNIEQLLALKPELVISSDTYTASNDKVKLAGIPLVQLDLETPEDMIKSYEIIGQIFGKEKEAGEYIDYYNQKMAEVSNTTAGISKEELKTVYFGQTDPLSTFGGDYYETDIAKTAGLDSVSKELSGGSNKVTIDQIYTWNPDSVILLPYCTVSVDELLADPAWKALPAVETKSVYRMPKYIMSWELPVPESILGTLWMQSAAYPDAIKFDMRNEITNFYKKFYGVDLTSSQVDNILQNQTPIILKNKPSS